MRKCVANTPNCPTVVHNDWKGEDGLWVWHEFIHCDECKEHGSRDWAQDLGGEHTNEIHSTNDWYECKTCTG